MHLHSSSFPLISVTPAAFNSFPDFSILVDVLNDFQWTKK